jgi:hypothetical protein
MFHPSLIAKKLSIFLGVSLHIQVETTPTTFTITLLHPLTSTPSGHNPACTHTPLFVTMVSKEILKIFPKTLGLQLQYRAREVSGSRGILRCDARRARQYFRIGTRPDRL